MVDQLRNLADERLINGCIYCGGPEETKDHVPSRVFLDRPFPENLPNVPACRNCNNGFSIDEEYLACLIEAVIAGSTDPNAIQRARVAETLRRSPALRARLEATKSEREGETAFFVDEIRVRSVITKLARGHAAFELSAVCRDEPETLRWLPIHLMTEEEFDLYDAAHVVQMFGEIGSRGMQRICVVQPTIQSSSGEVSSLGHLILIDWVEVQDSRYRYLAVDDNGRVNIKIVIREYLACEVSWNRANT